MPLLSAALLFKVGASDYGRSGSFTLKIIRVKIFVLSFDLQKKILTVDDCNKDECLAGFWHLVYYQVSGQPGIAGCSRHSGIYLRECGAVHKLIH